MLKVVVKCKEPEGYRVEATAYRTSVTGGMFAIVTNDETIYIPHENIIEVTEVRV